MVWDDIFTSYGFGHSHPIRPLRLELTMALAGQLGVLKRPNVRVKAPTPNRSSKVGLALCPGPAQV